METQVIPFPEDSEPTTFSNDELDTVIQTICKMHSSENVCKNSVAGRRSKNNRPFPTRLEVGRRLFAKIAVNRVVDFFITLVKHVTKCENKNLVAASTNNKKISDTELVHILIEGFFVWFGNIEHIWKKQKISSARNEREQERSDDFRPTTRTPTPPRGRKRLQSNIKGKDATITMDEVTTKFHNVLQPSGAISANPLPNLNADSSQINSRSTSKPPPQQRIIIHAAQRDKLVELLAPIDFPAKSRNIWNLIVNSLDLKSPRNIVVFASRIMEMSKQGRVSFNLLNYCLSRHQIHCRMAHPRLVVQTLLMGPISATTVENFVSLRTEGFRAEIRELLLKAESWKFNEKEFELAAHEFAHKELDQLPPFSQFCANVTTLLRELRNEMDDQENAVDDSWAHRLIVTSANKFYTEKTWSHDQFNDLVHTLLVQRPTLKSFLLNVLLKDHKDKAAFDRWRNFVSSDRYRMTKNFEKGSARDESSSEYLSLPRHCEVFVVCNATQFRVFHRQFEEYAQKKTSRVVVGVDAEWNPYVKRNRASLLQLALPSSVYLLDLDALYRDSQFLAFIEHLFTSKEIVKLGYQFSDDLLQLRFRLPECLGLYRPQSVICVGQLADELVRRSKRVPDFPLNDFVLPITAEETDKVKEHNRGIKLHDGGHRRREGESDNEATSNGLNNTKRVPAEGEIRFSEQGLSCMCRRILGRHLDKQEQCSVWDRRPLRNSQIRYAALDANCLLQIYQRCREWSARLGKGDDPLALVSTHSVHLHASLPLFSKHTLASPTPLPPEDASSAAGRDANSWADCYERDYGWD